MSPDPRAQLSRAPFPQVPPAVRPQPPPAPRPRHYLSPISLILIRPLLRYSHGRSAYVLRFVGNRRGPVLRQERRRRQGDYRGADRRGSAFGGASRHMIAD
jgi:hypothetical protein